MKKTLLLVFTLLFAAGAWAQTEYERFGSIPHEWGDESPVRIRHAFLGGALPTGMTPAGIFDGLKITFANSQNAGADGQYYMKKAAGHGEDWNLYYDADFTDPLSNLVDGQYYGGSNTGDFIAGHVVFDPGTDTFKPSDPRGSSSHPDYRANPSHMWAPGSTNGSQSQNNTLEFKALATTALNTGDLVTIVDCFWSELNNGKYFVERSTADNNTRFLLWKDAGFTNPVLPDNDDAVITYINSLGGNATGYWEGYLFSTINGRIVAYTPPCEVWVDDDFDSSTPGWGVDHFDKIQDGINEVCDGGIVNVAAGTYTETLQINKSITLLGPNADISPNNGSRVDEAIITNPGARVFEMKQSGIEFTVNGFTLQKVGTFLTNQGASNIEFDIRHNIFRDGTSTQSLYFRSHIANLIFHDNLLFCDEDRFVYMRTYRHASAGPNIIQITNNVWYNYEAYAIMSNSDAGEISGNTFIGGDRVNGSSGMLIATSGNDLVIKNNTFKDFVTGIGYGFGIALFDNFKGELDVNNNSFVNNDRVGILIVNGAELNDVAVNNNYFENNTLFDIDNRSTTYNLDATCNWFGTDVYSEIEARQNGDISFAPYLVLDTDGDPYPWDDENKYSCVYTVPYNEDTGNVYATIQDAIDDPNTLPGHTIIIPSGSYTEDVNDDKGVNFSPGTSAGCVEIDGDFTVTPTTTFTMEIFGAVECEAIDSYDQFDVSGTLTLSNSNLDIKLIGYEPPVGTEFTLFKYGLLDGEFNNPKLINIGNTYFVLDYGDGENSSITLTTVAPTFKMEINTAAGQP